MEKKARAKNEVLLAVLLPRCHSTRLRPRASRGEAHSWGLRPNSRPYITLIYPIYSLIKPLYNPKGLGPFKGLSFSPLVWASLNPKP